MTIQRVLGLTFLPWEGPDHTRTFPAPLMRRNDIQIVVAFSRPDVLGPTATAPLVFDDLEPIDTEISGGITVGMWWRRIGATGQATFVGSRTPSDTPGLVVVATAVYRGVNPRWSPTDTGTTYTAATGAPLAGGAINTGWAPATREGIAVRGLVGISAPAWGPEVYADPRFIVPDPSQLAARRATTATDWISTLEIWDEGNPSTTPPSIQHDPNYPVWTNFVGWELGVLLTPAPPQPPLLVAIPEARLLGCAESYTVTITSADYQTRLVSAPWSGLRWSRCLDDISEASVVVPDSLVGEKCRATLVDLLPWSHGLLIERNDQEVWSGPVIGVGRVRGGAPGLSISAKDALVRYQRLPATWLEAITAFDQDAATAFKWVIDNARRPGSQWELRCPLVSTGLSVSREIRWSDLDYAWDVLKELLASSVDATVIAGRLALFDPQIGWVWFADGRDRRIDGKYNDYQQLEYGMFTNSAWTSLPEWEISGMTQANIAAVPSSNSGSEGYRQIAVEVDETSIAEFDTLFYVSPSSLSTSSASGDPQFEATALQARAQTLVALRSRPPAVIEGGELSPSAPVPMSEMIPGSVWNIDVEDAGYRQLVQSARLKRVDVTVSNSGGGIAEKVAPTLQPIGWEAADA